MPDQGANDRDGQTAPGDGAVSDGERREGRRQSQAALRALAVDMALFELELPYRLLQVFCLVDETLCGKQRFIGAVGGSGHGVAHAMYIITNFGGGRRLLLGCGGDLADLIGNGSDLLHDIVQDPTGLLGAFCPLVDLSDPFAYGGYCPVGLFLRGSDQV